jgi:hypothetical protein
MSDALALGQPYQTPLTSWLWLVDVADTGRAIVVGDSARLVDELRVRFRDVRTVDLASLAAESPGAASCIALAPTIDVARVVDQAAVARAALTPRGCLSLRLRNPWWFRAPRIAGIIALGRTERALRTAGFTTVLRFFTSPSPAEPYDIVPDARHALIASQHSAVKNNPRELLARAGMGRVLFPGVLLVAVA